MASHSAPQSRRYPVRSRRPPVRYEPVEQPEDDFTTESSDFSEDPRDESSDTQSDFSEDPRDSDSETATTFSEDPDDEDTDETETEEEDEDEEDKEADDEASEDEKTVVVVNVARANRVAGVTCSSSRKRRPARTRS